MVAILTTEQRNLLVDRTFNGFGFFNTDVQDANGNYFISENEINDCNEEDLQWVKNLQLSELNPKIYDNLI